MSLFTPFSFLKQEVAAPAPPPSWTPADLGGLQEWWNTGAGLSISAGAVQSWTGQENSTVLTKNTGTGLTYTAADSDVNNRPTIAQNASRNLATLENNSITSFTPTTERYIGFIGFTGDTSISDWRIMGGNTTTGGTSSEIAMFQSNPGNPNTAGAYFFTGGAKTGPGTSTNELFWFVVQVNSAGTGGNFYYNNTNPTSFTGVSVTDLSPYCIEVGGYDNSSGFNWDGKVMEVFVCNGTITSGDLSDLDSYVTDYYS